jgi:putative N6-adenine-specific DNA methylase
MFYSCLPGLELLLAQQLRPLQARVISGGCEVTSSSVSSPSVASHRLERIASFQCRFFSELLEEVKKMPVKNDGLKLELSVSASKSRLYHVGAIAERIQRHIEVVEKGQGDARLLFRLHRDVCEVSLERGDPFHKRGYRLEGGKAPLREDLAAALIEASAIDFKNELVIDPFCGSYLLLNSVCLFDLFLSREWHSSD